MTTDELYKLADYHGVSLVEIFPVANEIMAALIKAKVKHAAMRGSHEGYAVILEELDELWDEVKKDAYHNQRKEALHVAAMALRFLTDVTTPAMLAQHRHPDAGRAEAFREDFSK